MRRIHLLLLLVLLPLQMVWASAVACHADAAAQAAAHQAVLAVAAGVPDSAPGAAAIRRLQAAAQAPRLPDDWPQWEFAPDEELDIVEQLSRPEWGAMTMDELSCRVVGPDDSSAVPVPDVHEFGLPRQVPISHADLRAALFAAPVSAPAPAPVFPALRPPSPTA